MKRIEIETETCLTTDGKKGIRVLAITALGFEELPEEYLNGTGIHCWKGIPSFLTISGASDKFNHTINILEGDVFSETDFNGLLDLIRMCGERLSAILKERKALEKSWCGSKKTYVI